MSYAKQRDKVVKGVYEAVIDELQDGISPEDIDLDELVWQNIEAFFAWDEDLGDLVSNLAETSREDALVSLHGELCESFDMNEVVKSVTIEKQRSWHHPDYATDENLLARRVTVFGQDVFEVGSVYELQPDESGFETYGAIITQVPVSALTHADHDDVSGLEDWIDPVLAKGNMGLAEAIALAQNDVEVTLSGEFAGSLPAMPARETAEEALEDLKVMTSDRSITGQELER